MQNKTAFGAIAAASATMGLLFSASPASAQTVDDFTPSCRDGGVLSYIAGPGLGSVSNSAPVPGDVVVVTSGAGSFDPGASVSVSFNGTALPGSPVVAGGDGKASISFTVPTGLADGTYVIVFRGPLNGATNVFGVCVDVAAPAAGGNEAPATPAEPVAPAAPVDEPIEGGVAIPVAAPDRPSALPFTGSVELLAVAGLGAALVAVGAGTVVVARRRRDGALSA